MDNLKKYYEVAASALFGGANKKVVKANETLSFEARESETLAIVGESGCGKSTFAKVLMGLETATDGKILLHNTEIQDTPIEARDTKTISNVQMVFQNPFDTLNPSMTVGRQIIRALEIFGIGDTEADREARMLELLDLVKLPREFAGRMPRQLSGGQKQRVGIARAFAGDAKIVVADEPVSALDVSVQAAVTDLRVPAALPPLYRGTSKRGPNRGYLHREEAYCAGGRHPVGHEPAPRLPVPNALPLEGSGPGRFVRKRRPPGAPDGGRPSGQMPPRRRHSGAHGTCDQNRRRIAR